MKQETVGAFGSDRFFMTAIGYFPEHYTQFEFNDLCAQISLVLPQYSMQPPQ